uniref:Major capsid protein N-terminal domain-containing protein n=1 Tax=viral metagenome TaxID=1070528 RepID=A0A6C0D7M3_9ZZZZ
MTEFNSEGALYELLARGNKDVYFQSDTLTSQSPFRNNYKRVSAYIHELRKIPPTNNTDFGKTIEFNFEVAGDLYTHPTLLIDLPSWYPNNQTYIDINNKQQQIYYDKSVVYDNLSNTYGYTSGIGYFLFEQIQIYQDQIMVQEFSGDALYATRLSRGSLNSATLENELVGLHDGSDVSVSRNGKPNILRLELPLLGCQHKDDGGFPSFAVRSQNFRLRCKLRNLEDLIESSDSQVKPNPFSKTMYVQSYSSQVSRTPIQTLDRYSIGQPTIYLETRHIYVDPDTQKGLVDSYLETPFSRLYENIFYFNEKDYTPLARGALADTTKRIDAVHPASRIVFFLRQQSDLQKNKLWKISSDVSNNEYYNNISLLIASRDRESLFPPLVWNTLTQHAKEDRYSGSGLGVMCWDLGEQKGRRAPFARQPEGTLNFSTADRPTFYIELQQIAGSNRNTEMRLIVDTWASYEIEDRRGNLKYAN